MCGLSPVVQEAMAKANNRTKIRSAVESTKTRVESDTFGPIEVPADR